VGCPMRTRGEERLEMPTFALFGAKNFGFFEIYGMSARTRGERLSQCENFAGEGSIFCNYVQALKTKLMKVIFSFFTAQRISTAFIGYAYYSSLPAPVRLLLCRINIHNHLPLFFLNVFSSSTR